MFVSMIGYYMRAQAMLWLYKLRAVRTGIAESGQVVAFNMVNQVAFLFEDLSTPDTLPLLPSVTVHYRAHKLSN